MFEIFSVEKVLYVMVTLELINVNFLIIKIF